LTALLTEARLFQTGSIALPASRFVCEHLHQNLFWACISRIHAQVPVVTTGQLAKTLRQNIPCCRQLPVGPSYPAAIRAALLQARLPRFGGSGGI
jgi:hypothetical protein